MGAGEYTSVASQVELGRAEIEIERREIALHPVQEEEELAQLYISRGVEPGLARDVAAQISRDPEQALMVHVREELGLDPEDLPSPLVAALSSFLCFGFGALLPVLPYLFGATVLLPALVIALIGLFACGALVSRVTDRTWWFSGVRQLVLGAAAAGLTYGIGSLVEVGLT
jgi:VIT1/CCC1 family predicted Fe2+/Mn2+ transporter